MALDRTYNMTKKDKDGNQMTIMLNRNKVWGVIDIGHTNECKVIVGSKEIELAHSYAFVTGDL